MCQSQLCASHTQTHIRICRHKFAYFQFLIFKPCKLQEKKLPAEMEKCIVCLLTRLRKTERICHTFAYFSLQLLIMCLLKRVLSTAVCVSNILAEVGGRGEAVVWLLILAALRLVCSQKQVTTTLYVTRGNGLLALIFPFHIKPLFSSSSQHNHHKLRLARC